MRKTTLTVAAGDPRELAALLAARLGMPVAEAEALVARGAVHVDGRRSRGPIASGARIVVHLDERVVPRAPSPSYADKWLLVVDKPAGISSQATRASDTDNLEAQVRADEPDARLMHRLDRDASGLVLFARSVEARQPLQALFDEGRVERRYLARVSGRLDGAGRIELRIARHSSDERLRVALPTGAPGGETAATRWQAVVCDGVSTLVAVELETGRTHQIRVHFAAIGHPLVGDALYGGPPAPRLALHAVELALPHPRDGRRLVVRTDDPRI
jgi:RluA family pseudouridine synthase